LSRFAEEIIEALREEIGETIRTELSAALAEQLEGSAIGKDTTALDELTTKLSEIEDTVDKVKAKVNEFEYDDMSDIRRDLQTLRDDQREIYNWIRVLKEKFE